MPLEERPSEDASSFECRILTDLDAGNLCSLKLWVSRLRFVEVSRVAHEYEVAPYLTKHDVHPTINSFSAVIL